MRILRRNYILIYRIVTFLFTDFVHCYLPKGLKRHTFLLTGFVHCYLPIREILEKFQNNIDWSELRHNKAIDWKDPNILILAHAHDILWDVLGNKNWNSEEYFNLKNNTKFKSNWLGIQRDFLSFNITWQLKEFIEEFDSFRRNVGPEDNQCYGSQTFFDMYKSTLENVFENFWKNNVNSNLQLYSNVNNCYEYFSPFEESFYTKRMWESLSKSQVIPWNFEIIENYQNQWHWLYLLKNPTIDWTIPQLLKYKKEIENFTWSNDFRNDIHPNAWNGLLTNTNLKISLEDIAKIGYPNWKYLSLNNGINFTFEVLNYIKDVLIPIIQPNCDDEGIYNCNSIPHPIFRNLHKSKSIKWSYEILYKYKELLDWKDRIYTDTFNLNYKSLSFIDDLFYTEKFIEDFSDVIDFTKLSRSDNVEWSIELIKKYESSWNSSYLKCNKAIQCKDELSILYPEKFIEKYEYDSDATLGEVEN